MNRLKMLNLVVLVLLGLASGVSKLLRTPQEMAFFQGEMGFSTTTIVLFGAAQMLAAILLVPLRTRIAGAILLAVTLAVSAVLVFVSGKIAFGFFSLLPLVLSAFVIRSGAVKAQMS